MTFFRKISVVLVLVGALAASVFTVTAQERSSTKGRLQEAAPLDLALQRAIAAGAARTRVIIRVEPDSYEELKTTLQRRRYRLISEHPLISALTMDVPVGALKALARLRGVLSVSSDSLVGIAADTVSVDVGVAGTLLRDTLGLTGSSFTGAGVGVAVIDSGIDRSTDFGMRTKFFYDFTRGGIPRAAYDDHGHGTHVAGLIGGTGALSNGLYVGVAPDVTLIGLKVLNANGSGYTSDVIRAIEFATQHKAALGIDVINLSLGHPLYESAATDPLVQAVERASAAGIVVVASAGNVGINSATGLPGFGGIVSPGNARSAVTVGSGHTLGTKRRTDDLVGPYSSRGPTRFDLYAKPDLIAPGHRLIAPAALGGTLALSHPSWLVPSPLGVPRYIRLTGASMATAVTSGVAALVIQANRAAVPPGVSRPALTPNTVKGILQFTALTMRDESQTDYSRLVQGAGALNGGGAVALAGAINTAAATGQPWLTGAVEPFTDIDGVTPWAQSVLWGDAVLWGDTLYWNSPAWALAVLWGDNVSWGDNVVRGDDVEDILIWGDNTVWDDILIWGDNSTVNDILIWGDHLTEESSGLLTW